MLLLAGVTRPTGSAAPQGRMVWTWGPAQAAGQGGRAGPGTGGVRNSKIPAGMLRAPQAGGALLAAPAPGPPPAAAKGVGGLVCART